MTRIREHFFMMLKQFQTPLSNLEYRVSNTREKLFLLLLLFLLLIYLAVPKHYLERLHYFHIFDLNQNLDLQWIVHSLVHYSIYNLQCIAAKSFQFLILER